MINSRPEMSNEELIDRVLEDMKTDISKWGDYTAIDCLLRDILRAHPSVKGILESYLRDKN